MVRSRILSFMAEPEREPCANVAVFTHGGVMITKLRTPNCPSALYVGTKKLVKHKEFEEFISEKIAI